MCVSDKNDNLKKVVILNEVSYLSFLCLFCLLTDLLDGKLSEAWLASFCHRQHKDRISVSAKKGMMSVRH